MLIFTHFHTAYPSINFQEDSWGSSVLEFSYLNDHAHLKIRSMTTKVSPFWVFEGQDGPTILRSQDVVFLFFVAGTHRHGVTYPVMHVKWDFNHKTPLNSFATITSSLPSYSTASCYVVLLALDVINPWWFTKFFTLFSETKALMMAKVNMEQADDKVRWCYLLCLTVLQFSSYIYGLDFGLYP